MMMTRANSLLHPPAPPSRGSRDNTPTAVTSAPAQRIRTRITTSGKPAVRSVRAVEIRRDVWIYLLCTYTRKYCSLRIPHHRLYEKNKVMLVNYFTFSNRFKFHTGIYAGQAWQKRERDKKSFSSFRYCRQQNEKVKQQVAGTRGPQTSPTPALPLTLGRFLDSSFLVVSLF